MNLYKYIKENISLIDDLSIEDMSWLYLSVIHYNGNMKLSAWINDKRMNGVLYSDSLNKFKKMNLCNIENDIIEYDINKSLKEIDKIFGTKTFEDAILKTYNFTKYNNGTYPIFEIPIEYFIMYKKPQLDKAFDKLDYIRTDWFNYWSQKTALKLDKFKYKKESNLYYAWRYYYPNVIPEKITIYRGLKSEYNPLQFSRYENYYTSWTLDINEAERFSKYHFTKYSFQKPHESNIQTIIKSDVSINDISFFYGGIESEVIMKEPVQNIEIFKSLNNKKNEQILSENILVPRNLEGRKEKLRKQNIKLLSQEIIKVDDDADFEIDEYFENISNDLVKVKEIHGKVWLLISHIPSWLKNVKIVGDLACESIELYTLKNCPQYIEGDFSCSGNNLTSLKGCAQYVGGNFYCSYNDLTSLEGCPKYVGGYFKCNNNKIKLELPKGVELKGDFENE